MRASVIYIHNGTGILSVKKKRRRRIRRWFSTVCLKCPFTKESNNLIATEVAILILKYEIIETLVDSERGKTTHENLKGMRTRESLQARSHPSLSNDDKEVTSSLCRPYFTRLPLFPWGIYLSVSRLSIWGIETVCVRQFSYRQRLFCNRSKPEMYSSPGSRFIPWVLLSRQRAAAWEAGNGNLNGLVRK